jgi:hypothetical protein
VRRRQLERRADGQIEEGRLTMEKIDTRHQVMFEQLVVQKLPEMGVRVDEANSQREVNDARESEDGGEGHVGDAVASRN